MEERRNKERRSGFDRRRVVGISVILAVFGGFGKGIMSVFDYREKTETRISILEERADHQQTIDKKQDDDRQRMKDDIKRDNASILDKLDELKNILLRRGK